LASAHLMGHKLTRGQGYRVCQQSRGNSGRNVDFIKASVIRNNTMSAESIYNGHTSDCVCGECKSET
jgi:hypothetical protein